MKNKLSFISIFTLCIALSLTACGGKQSSNTDSKNTQTEAGSETSGKSDSKLDDLYQQENQLFADHADVWNKAFADASQGLHRLSVLRICVGRLLSTACCK